MICRQKHDAVLIATGVYKARDLGAPGSGLEGHRARPATT
jgi:glutamate synthase (NADPH/NADH) small chain